ncbi:MAG: quinone oxidoreductase [Rhodobiaceae bacterium]|nr:quinone oxidoreductase [Rhodobiaceae bacterium]
MRAIQIDTYGGPDVLIRRELDIPKPGAGQLLVKLAVAGINFMDVHTRIGKYHGSTTYPVTLPVTLGVEGAGEVIETGPGVDDFRPGDRVAYCLVWGSYADYAVVTAARAVKLPDGISHEMAASSLFHGLTAHYLLHEVGQLAKGDSCLIHAASGGIGQIMVQLAVAMGIRVLATASTPEKRAIVEALGAEKCFAYDAGGFAEHARAATGGKGVDVVFDALGKETLRDSFRAARKRGLIVNFGSVTGSVTDLNPIELGEAGSLFLTRPRLADHVASAEEFRMRANDIFAAILAGQLQIRQGERYTMDSVEEAHESLETRGVTGKPLLIL